MKIYNVFYGTMYVGQVEIASSEAREYEAKSGCLLVAA